MFDQGPREGGPPLVAVVVPVYNGAEYLEACLSSVERQTYGNWRAVVVNNCSRDETGVIADRFASRDRRFRVEHCTEFLSQAGNYNRAVALADPDARFVKILEADNLIWPECLERQVAIARTDEEIGFVGCYSLHGEELRGDGFPAFRNVLSGREAARTNLRGEAYFFGTPTTLLFNHQALRSVSPAFRPEIPYDDVDLCIRLLKRWKFGFDHRVLAFVRTENDGLFKKHLYFDCLPVMAYSLLRTHGPDFFESAELKALIRSARAEYYDAMGWALWVGKNSEYWRRQKEALAQLGERLKRLELTWHAVGQFLKLALNPLSTLQRLARRRRRRAEVATGVAKFPAAGAAEQKSS